MSDLIVHMSDLIVREATAEDATACAAIYEPYVRDTAITFETDPPTADEMAARIEAAQRTHAWLVLDDGDAVVGYAYGGAFRTRAAYRWSCEVSIYVEPGRQGSGSGRLLYGALLDRLADRGYRLALAGMALPNDASLRLHRAMGFEPVGTFRRVGWKHGRWHDVAWAQRDLGGGGVTMSTPPTRADQHDLGAFRICGRVIASQ